MDLRDLPLEARVIGPFLRARAADLGDRPYFTLGGRTWSFRETERMSRAVARGLARRGIGEGSRVMLLMPNRAEFVFGWYACSLLGAAIVPVNVNLKGFLLDAQVEDAAPDGLVVAASLLPALATVRPDLLARLPWVCVAGACEASAVPVEPARACAFEDLVVHDGPDPEVEPDYRRIQVISYTSGTTGPAKGVMIPNGQCFSAACSFMRLSAMQADDVLYSPLPLFHGMTSRMCLVPALVLGAQAVVDERFSASGYFERAAACGATLGFVVHAIVPLIKAQPPGPGDRAHRVRALFNAGHDLEFEARFGVRTIEAFSMTETNFLAYTHYPERKVGAAGRAHEDWELALVDEKDRPVPPGEPGELIARPRKPWIMMQGYLNKPQQTADAWRNLWFHTGDILRCDEDGYYWFIDRRKDRIRRRGENVSSADVEAGVGAHPDIAESVALPRPGADGEDDIRVVAVLRAGATLQPADLHAWLAVRLPKFMLPRYVEFVAALPRTGTNKVEKHRLVAQGPGPGAWDATAHGRSP